MTDLDTSAFVPPFEREKTYPLSVLHDYESSVEAAISQNKALRTWARSPSGSNKKFVKWRADEILPLYFFTNFNSPQTYSHFRFPKENDPVDAQLGDGTNFQDIQITVAHPDWTGNATAAGYQRHLAKEILNQDGVLFGQGPLEKAGGKIVNKGRMLRSANEGNEACRRGIRFALQNKANDVGAGTFLLIHLAEPGPSMTSSLDEVVLAAAGDCEKLPGFDATYVFTHDALSSALNNQHPATVDELPSTTP